MKSMFFWTFWIFVHEIWVRFTYFYPPLTSGHLKLTEGQGDYPGVGEEERRYECHDELPKEGLSEGEFTL